MEMACIAMGKPKNIMDPSTCEARIVKRDIPVNDSQKMRKDAQRSPAVDPVDPVDPADHWRMITLQLPRAVYGSTRSVAMHLS